MLMHLRRKIVKLIFLSFSLSAFLCVINYLASENKQLRKPEIVYNRSEDMCTSEKNSILPFIFVGGYGRSGTTLMRAILDVHPSIKCGPETKVLPTFVNFVVSWKKKFGNSLETDWKNAGIESAMVDAGIINFVTHIMLNRGFTADRYCAKDPDLIVYMDYLHSIFPSAKFIYMVRDGRAAAYSYMTQVKESMTFRKYRTYLSSWKSFNTKASNECKKLGEKYCLLVRYEDLVLHPKSSLQRVVKFLNVKWTDELLKHQEHIGNEISISKTEWSSHQIIKPINSESLYSWVNGKIEIDYKQMKFLEPILNSFNYSFNISFVKLDRADPIVLNNNQMIKNNQDFWDNKGRNLSQHIVYLEKKNQKR